MTDHYSGHDPGLGCALMIVAGSAGLVGFLIGLAVGAWLL